MGRFSRNKGYRIENELVTRLRAAGISATRVPLSGQTEHSSGDLVIRFANGNVLQGEAKARRAFPAYLSDWLNGNDFVVLRPDKADPVVLLPWALFTELINDREAADIFGPP